MHEAIQGRDIIDIIKPLFDEGWYISISDGRIKPPIAINCDAPWIFINPNPKLHCNFDMNLFKAMNFAPRNCRNCYKVVIRPNTVKQLIKLYELMKTKFIQNGLYCKCGIEDRPYVNANYGGYNYNQGLKSGKRSYKIIRKLIDEEIDPSVSVILKRGCTEMELALGPTKQYQPPEWADAEEDKITQYVDFIKNKIPTPKLIADHTFRKWLEFAWDRKDNTCLEFSDGIPIYPNKIDTYHEEV
jgi:hypothetical protein